MSGVGLSVFWGGLEVLLGGVVSVVFNVTTTNDRNFVIIMFF